MATYNGARFLTEQIESIFGQSWDGQLSLLIRDDGSSDTTSSLLDAHADRYPALSRIRDSARKGVIGSFITLLSTSDPQADFIAFADQDDVWQTHKLNRAIERLSSLPLGMPGLYCSRLTYVDERLHVIGASPIPPRGPDFRNALVENIATGCTVVINRAARDLLLSAPPPQHAQMHDWWFYLVVSAFGAVLYDETPSILYRQHGANVVGAAPSFPKALLRKIKGQLNRPKGLLRTQALEFLELYGDRLPPHPREIVERFLEATAGKGIITYARDPIRVFRQSRLDDMALLTLLALRRI